MDKATRYILELNHSNFINYVAIITAIAILDNLTNGLFTEAGIKIDALLWFLTVSSALNLYYLEYYPKNLLAIIDNLVNLAIISLKSPKKLMMTGAVISGGWFLFKQNQIQSLINISKQTVSSDLVVYFLLATLYLLIIRTALKEDV